MNEINHKDFRKLLAEIGRMRYALRQVWSGRGAAGGHAASRPATPFFPARRSGLGRRSAAKTHSRPGHAASSESPRTNPSNPEFPPPMTTPNVLLLAVLTGILHAQGPLTPSGPPEATMKTLDQIEPRTPISSLPYTISQSGSYYFTGNLQFTANSGDAITITASNVTLDLMGFTLSSSAAVTGVGISVLDTGITIRCISIRNGAIAGNTTVTASGSPTTWSVNLAGFVSGISNACSHASFNDLIVKGTQSYGLVSFADYATVSNVHAEQNGGSGINTRSGSITNSTASLNGSDGIYCYFGSVTNSTASFNTTFDINAPNSAVAFCRFTTFSLTGSTRTGNYPSP